MMPAYCFPPRVEHIRNISIHTRGTHSCDDRKGASCGINFFFFNLVGVRHQYAGRAAHTRPYAVGSLRNRSLVN